MLLKKLKKFTIMLADLKKKKKKRDMLVDRRDGVVNSLKNLINLIQKFFGFYKLLKFIL